MKKIAFIGFGRFGKALATVLKTREAYEIAAYDVQKSDDPCQLTDVNSVLEGADVVFFTVPSSVFRACAESLQVPGVPLVSCAKGIDPSSKKMPADVLRELFSENDVAVLSGPMLAEEVEGGLPAACTIASKDHDTAQQICEIFSGTSVAAEASTDVVGVSWCGILKNVYAIALGISDGLALGDNYKSVVTKRAFKEIEEILVALGGMEDTVHSYAGIGDLLATGYSTKSRNYSYGFALGAGKELPDALAEGVKNVQNISELIDITALPVFLAVFTICVNGADPSETFLEIHKPTQVA